MGRRIVLFGVAAAVLAGGGYAAYRLGWAEPAPQHVAPPTFVPPPTPSTPPAADDFTTLAQTDPVAMYELCLARYAREVKGFRATMEKHERIRGKLHDREIVRVVGWGEVPEEPGQEPPVRVRMIWDQGAQKDFLGNEVRGSLYVAGEHGNNLVAWRPTAALLKTKEVDPKDTLARDASRYCITSSGLYGAMLRTYAAWKRRKDAGLLRAEYLGTQVVEKAGGRVCHVIRRKCPSPEVDPFALDEEAPTDPKIVARDGATEITVTIDAGRWIQVGSVLKRAGGDLLGEYYFRDVELTNAEFPPDTFTIEGMKAAGQRR